MLENIFKINFGGEINRTTVQILVYFLLKMLQAVS